MPLPRDAALRKDRTNAHDLTTFQHRHYAAIAGIISELGDARESVAAHFARKLASNPRFDKRRFLEACNAASQI